MVTKRKGETPMTAHSGLGGRPVLWMRGASDQPPALVSGRLPWLITHGLVAQATKSPGFSGVGRAAEVTLGVGSAGP